MPDAPARPRRLRVFLAHASEDLGATRALAERLEARGMVAWMDARDLLPGQDWRREVERAMRASDAVVACRSRRALAKEGFVQKEVRLALDIAQEKPAGTLFLVPVLLDDAEPGEDLAHIHHVRLDAPDGFARLCRALALRAEQVGAAPPDPPAAPAPPAVPTPAVAPAPPSPTPSVPVEVRPARGPPRPGAPNVLRDLTPAQKRILLFLLDNPRATTSAVIGASGLVPDAAKRARMALEACDPPLLVSAVVGRRGLVTRVIHWLTPEGLRAAERLRGPR